MSECMLPLRWRVMRFFVVQKVKVFVTSRACLFVTPWTAARQDPVSVEFSRREYWSG